MNSIATTERLRILPFTRDDAGFILRLVNTESWLKYIGDREVHSLVAAERYLENGPIKSYADNGFGGYLLEEIATGEKIGSCGMYKREGLEYPDLGFALLPEFEGKGYAFEASEQLLKDSDLETICAITAKDNTRSVQLLERLGFRWDSFVRLPNDQEQLNLFLLKRKL